MARERGLAEAESKDRRMVERLAQIHAEIAVHYDLKRANVEYAAAFREYGVDVETLDPAEAGARLGASPIASELANALDQWTYIRRGSGFLDGGGAPRLVAIAKATDPDPWRNRLRDTLAEAATDRGRALLALQRLSATADPKRLPEASVTRLASALSSLGSRGIAIDLLRRSQRVHPDDFWVNADLATQLAGAGRFDEAVRFFSVALAIRPRSDRALRDLGDALRAAGRTDEAAMYPRAMPAPPGPPGGPSKPVPNHRANTGDRPGG
jgi:eukaryotic-like serine/threonine-protein kinase